MNKSINSSWESKCVILDLDLVEGENKLFEHLTEKHFKSSRDVLPGGESCHSSNFATAKETWRAENNAKPRIIRRKSVDTKKSSKNSLFRTLVN